MILEARQLIVLIGSVLVKGRVMSEWLVFTDEVVTVDETGKELQRAKVINQGYRQILSKKTSLEMVAIPGGQCLMGAPRNEEGWQLSQGPQHLVTIASFLMGRYPITQAQWREVAKLDPVTIELNPYPAYFEGQDRPIEQITWWEAVEFCDRLSQLTGSRYRLPREAEWEYACRAHTITPFHVGVTLSTDLANYSGIDWEYAGKICSRGSYGQGSLGIDRRATTPIGMFEIANPFGLYDLHGNVREWCADNWRDSYNEGTIEDKDRRVLRGGSWNGGPRQCRSAYRVKFLASASLYDIGLRVVRDDFP
jgi:formylglycine-generating enzyme required for sulfatase activity